MPADVGSLAQALLRCPSVTPAEAGALDLLEKVLGERGFDTHRVAFSETGLATIDNLYARFGTAPPCLLFAGHTDVVPPGPREAWRHDPFAGTVENGILFGRGAQDMKGGIAAFVAAVLAFLDERNSRFPGSIALLITGDEEGPAVNGTIKLLDWAVQRGERFDQCIVGEPTSRRQIGDMIKIGRRGSLNGRAIATGRQGHVAYPTLADNPIPALLRALAALREPLDAGTEHFAASNLEITSIDVGNTATNVIPGRAEAAFNVRFNDTWRAQSLAAELEARVARVADGADVTLAFQPCNAPAFLTPASPFTELVADSIRCVTGISPELSTSGGTSDARFIQQVCPVVEFGLVGDAMHMVDEHVPLADLETLVAIYRHILQGLFP